MSRLFSKVSIFDVVTHQQGQIKTLVQSLAPNYLLNASEEDLVKSLVSELRFEVPILDENGIHVSDFGESQIDVSRDPMRMILDPSRPFYVAGVQMTVSVPFQGNAEFFEVRPQTFTYPVDVPEIEVTQNELLLTYRRPDHNSAALKNGYESFLKTIKQSLASLQESASQFNSQIEGQVRQEVRLRKNKLLADAHMVEAIGLPIKRREGMPATYAVPVQKRSAKIERPPASAGPFQPEPVLSTEEYENILGIMRSMVRVMEQSPKAFEQMGEEDLRQHFLVQLNGQYQGRATGETFNFQGKTDILIREGDRNAFIAECKFWGGEKQLLKTIDQLLSYLSWRDTKAAIVIFNRNANFSDVLEKIAEAVPTHKNFKRFVGKIDESTFRYIFHQPGDPNRELTLSVLAFDVPTAEHRSK